MRRERKESAVGDSMNTKETIQFLEESGVHHLDDWSPGQPVLYVLTANIQNGVYSHLPQKERPSIARVDSPTHINFDKDNARKQALGEDAEYLLKNRGGRIDYYVIDKATKQARIVRTSATHNDSYVVLKRNLFHADDSLFPPGTE